MKLILSQLLQPAVVNVWQLDVFVFSRCAFMLTTHLLTCYEFAYSLRNALNGISRQCILDTMRAILFRKLDLLQ